MITLVTGDRYRNLPSDPEKLEGYELQPDGRTFKQIFLPCKYRYTAQCSKCPAGKQNLPRPACSLKKIKSTLTCVGCSERKQ